MKASTLFNILLLSAGAVCAQTDKQAVSSSSPLATAADQEWATLKAQNRRKPGPPSMAPVATVVEPAQRQQAIRLRKQADREQQAADHVQQADRLKSFYSRNPGHAQAREAKRMEALMLLRASQAGDTSQQQRRRQLVAEVRADPAIPVAQRAEVGAFSDNLDVLAKPNLSRDERLAAYEETLRQLLKEFPEVPTGYESFLQLAVRNPEEKARAMSRELLEMPAPAAVKAEAQTLLDRLSLVGQSLADLTLGTPERAQLAEFTQGRPAILYVWATWSRGSLALGKVITEKARPGVVLIGINLDTDLEKARQAAGAAVFPDHQFYDALGRNRALAQKLKLTAAPLLYLVDAEGVLRSVSAQRDPASLIAAFGTK